MANFRKWYYLKFWYPVDSVLATEDKRVLKRMELMPFYLREDAEGMLRFILRQFTQINLKGDVQEDRFR